MLRPLALVGLFLLAPTHPALAQTQITTGVVQGTVTDATGAPLPGLPSRPAKRAPTRPGR